MASHFTFPERQILYRLLKAKKPRAEIARLMGRDRSTIYREIKRNTGGRGYRPKQARRTMNTNGLLRQCFPKGTDFARISRHAVARAETLLNERPRKRLGYRTPAEVLGKKLRCI